MLGNVLQISNLHATVADKPIINGLDLVVPTGEVHAIMGPNGAGKSTLAYVLGGRPGYEVTDGSVDFDGANLFELEPHERAAAGLFLGFQYPVEIPGVSYLQFLRESLNAQRRARDRQRCPAGQGRMAVLEERSGERRVDRQHFEANVHRRRVAHDQAEDRLALMERAGRFGIAVDEAESSQRLNRSPPHADVAQFPCNPVDSQPRRLTDSRIVAQRQRDTGRRDPNRTSYVAKLDLGSHHTASWLL